MIHINIKEQELFIKESINNNSITQDGELVQIHNDILDNIVKDIILINAVKETKNKDNKIKVMERKKNKTELEREIKNNLGNFYFNFYNYIPSGLEKQYKFRYIFMCCYLKHEDNRMVLKGDNGRYKSIKEYDLINILKLSERETRNTKNALIKHNLIHIDNNKNIIINDNISFIGKIGKIKDNDYSRIFKEGVIYLYNNSLKTEHKKLSLFIELLPFIHYDYNIICNNPNCELMQDIDPISLKDIINNFNVGKNITRVKNELLNMKVKDEKLLIMITDFNKSFFVVNPRIYYKGGNIENLKYLINLFKV